MNELNKQKRELAQAKRDDSLPSSLIESLAILTTLSRKIFSIKFGSLLLLSLSVSWLVLFISDRLWDTPIGVRLLLSCSGWLWAIFFAWMIRRNAFLRTSSSKWLARQVRAKFGGPGDRFLGVIELAQKRNTDSLNYSESLYQAALQRVEKEISKLSLSDTFDRQPGRQAGFVVILCLFATLACFYNYPGLAKNTSLRWVSPWSDLPRKTLTRFSNVPPTLYTAKGETIVLPLTLANDSEKKPDQIQLSGPNDIIIKARREGNSFKFIIPGQQNTKKFKLRAGDYRGEITLVPLSRPSIVLSQATVSYPPYLSLSDFETKTFTRSVSFPIGSDLIIKGQTDRGLSNVTASSDTGPLDSEKDKNSFHIRLNDVKKDTSVEIGFVDQFGLKPDQNHFIELLAKEDTPPTVEISKLPPESSILLLETKTLGIMAKDDFGVAESRLKMKAIRGNDLIIDSTLYIQSEKESNLTTTNFDFPFDPRLFSLQDGDIAEFSAQALDRMPGRELSSSRTVKFFVVGPEKHAQLIRARMEAIISRTSEIAREQESLLMETIDIEQMVEENEESIDPKTDQKLSKLADMQRANSRNLRNNADEGMKVLEEAARNPIFDQKAIEDFTETLERMKKVATSKMNLASSKMNEAQASPPSSATESLSEAEQLEREAISELQEILADSSEQLDRLEALNFAQRLRKIEQTENKLTQGILKILPTSIGANIERLTPRVSKEKDRMEMMQFDTHLEAGEIQKEISRFHERTGREVYGEVSKLMMEEKTESGLLLVSRKIEGNVAFEAMDALELWAEKFKVWADMLDDQISPPGSGSGQSQGEGMGKDITEQILALLRIRDGQGDIIKKTQVVDSGNFQAKRENWTNTLNDQQLELMLDLTDVQIELAEESLNPLFDDAHTAMSESATGLEKGEAGEVTQKAQAESKEITTDLINLLLEPTNSPQSNAQGLSMTALQFLMQQLGKGGEGKAPAMTPGKSGGGSNQGGTSDRELGENAGEVLNLPKDSRKSKKSGGMSQSPPPEFKKIMENYFRSIEE
ncbi:hypothetical protein OAQ34_02160 [Opitutales bacterium]|nr:hypothetical protein [Opitutales bacterium]